MKITDKKIKVLFVGEGVSLAHISRPLVLANSLNRDDYEIIFACGNQYKKFIEEANFPCCSLPTISSKEFLKRLAKGQPLYTTSNLDEYVKAELKLLSNLSPDLVVGDFRISLGISTELCRIPYIALSNAHWSPYSTQPLPLPEHFLVNLLGVNLSRFLFNRLQKIICKFHIIAYNKIRKKYRLTPLNSLQDMYTCGTQTFYLDLPSISPTKTLPPHHRFIGPVIWNPEIPLPKWWDEIPKNKPLIYITLGSTGDLSLLKTIIQTIQNLPVSAIISTANRINLSLLPPNIFVAGYLPGIEAIRRSDLVISNGGSATVYQALSQGKPILGLPSNMDQYFTMESIKRNGAGILIRTSDATLKNIERSIEKLLREKHYRNKAEELALEIKNINASKLFNQAIGDLFGIKNKFEQKTTVSLNSEEKDSIPVQVY